MNIKSSSALIAQLLGLGLSDLEARVYVALLASGTSTAYQLAQQIGKPTANVYKAVRSLAAKGGLATRRGKKQMLSAIPPEEFLRQLQRRHAELIAGAAKGLAAIQRPTEVDQLYVLENIDAVLERARAMIVAAESIVVIDVFPKLFAKLEKELRAARRAELFAVTYAPVDALDEAPRAHVVLAGGAKKIVSQWNCELLILVVDGKETLLALCNQDLEDVIHATWSNSLFQSCVQHAGMMREHFFHEIQELLAAENATPQRLSQLVKEHPTFLNLRVPGREALRKMISERESI